jgi:hypothetical protein
MEKGGERKGKEREKTKGKKEMKKEEKEGLNIALSPPFSSHTEAWRSLSTAQVCHVSRSMIVTCTKNKRSNISGRESERGRSEERATKRYLFRLEWPDIFLRCSMKF